MRSKSGTIRMIDGFHRLEKLRQYSLVDFGGDETPLGDAGLIEGALPATGAGPVTA
jgi:hypothetical protein